MNKLANLLILYKPSKNSKMKALNVKVINKYSKLE